MLYEIHLLKNYPPTNLNRDDSGAPKTCIFGGVSRGRVSSQCLKRSWRTSSIFRDAVGEGNLGVRTRKFPVLVKNKLIELGVDAEYAEAIQPVLTGFGNKEGKESKNGDSTAQVCFYSPEDIDAVAQIVKAELEKCSSVKDVRKMKAKDLLAAITDAQIRPITLDIAMFGRMVTCDSFRDVEASVQVAHAISTHKTHNDSDYFTAMDDLLTGSSMEEAGAAMIGSSDFNSNCFYVYANIDSDALLANMEHAEDAEQIVKKAILALIRTMALTNPSGKQNTFAGHVLPSVVLVECKAQKIPTNLANAFAEPVHGSKNLISESAKKLSEEVDSVSRNFGLEVKERLWFCVDKYDVQPESATKVCKTFQELIDAVAATM